MDANVIDTQLVRRLVASQFPCWGSLPLTPVTRQGVDNRTFRLGTDLSVRLPAGDWYALQVEKEQRWLPALASQLPLPIPEPVAQGVPASGYPHPWSVYRWIDGIPAADAITGWSPIASALAEFLTALRRVDHLGGPEPGRHNFFRGAPLSVYDDQTAAAIDTLGAEIDRAVVERVWSIATATSWNQAPVWFHGDVAPTNLLTGKGQLTAVIDFGTSGIGDPACDTVIAWTHLDTASRATFRRIIGLDNDTWARGRGWALWKALITLTDQLENNDDVGASISRAIINRIVTDAAIGR
ncbi:MAG: aminoglycoside phosphotransferase family protein [Mycobacterium sp.]|nr:aminoglycoside phosphotransferase family protein [Mycobacterium sp.]